MIRFNSIWRSLWVGIGVVVVGSSVVCAQVTRPAQSRPAATQPQTSPATQPELTLKDKLDRVAEVVAGVIARDGHGRDHWRAKSALQADFTLEWDGKTILESAVAFEIHRQRMRMQLKDGATAIFDGEKTWIVPPSASFPNSRFHRITWPYLLASPLRLGERGSQASAYRTATLQGRPFDVIQITYNATPGKNAGEWHLFYADQRTHRLHAIAHIILDPTAVEPGEPQTHHAVTFDDYQVIDGVLLATSWTIWNWSHDDIQGDPIGKVQFSNVKFVQPAEDAFIKPPGAREEK